MKALTLKDWFIVVLVVIVFAVLAYMFGLHMLFMHNAYEVFWYGLYFVAGLSLYQLTAWLYDVLFGAKPDTAKA